MTNMVEEYPDEHDHWEIAILESRTVDGFPSSTLHSPAGELEELRDSILDELDSLDEQIERKPIFDDYEGKPHGEHHDIQMLPRPLSHKIVSLFAISVGVMEKQVIDILSHSLIAEGYRKTEPSISLLQKRGFRRNLKLAKDLGLIESGEYSQVNDVRRIRNKLVHQPTERLSIAKLDIMEDRIRKATRAPGYLHEARSKYVPSETNGD